MATLKIFAYKGVIGAETDLENGKFLNDPIANGQLGCVVCTSEVIITSEAKELFKSLPREGGSFAGTMLTKHVDGSASIGVLGYWKHLIEEIGRDCDLSVLDMCTIDNTIEIPEGFREFVDNNED